MSAPPFDFIQRTFLPIVNRMGPRVEARLIRHGFYPRGGFTGQRFTFEQQANGAHLVRAA